MTDIVNTDSNLVEHAVQELRLLGADEDDIRDMVSVIQAFADVGMSGSQAAWHIALLPELLQFKNLTPLTDDPNEWIEHTEPQVAERVWQNKRNGEAFSTNGGKTYYLLSDGANSQNPHPQYVSKMQKVTS